MKYLLFRIYGPMCSWGDIAVGEIRPSFSHPAKSAVLGLVAGAMGIRREEEDKHCRLAETLGFAVLVECAGAPLSDYHTARVPSGDARYCTRKDELSIDKQSLNTILSTRHYRVDGLYTVVLWEHEQNNGSLINIREALLNPVFTPYLGRKSCPAALPFEPQLIEAGSIIEALEKGRFVDYQGFGINPSEQKMLFWDEDGASGIEQQHTFERRDVVLSRKRWQFDVRKERHAALK